ncbi:PqiC family protein [Salinibacter grassmerensis]|uniref:PqiC family protein n=1 Tax=Salinibacter grassmerensis TaxID=3040353 RepID=UPI0021E75A68|nr:PqiC family protein [Salinibacter grassmerensis]
MTVSFPSVLLRRLGCCAALAGLVALSVTGCVRLLEPRKSDATYYLLDSASAPDTVATQAPSADTMGLRVGLRAPRLASYLDETRIVTRHGPNAIEFSEFHRWGEDLDQGIGRTVARALEARPGIRSVEMVPWPRGATFDYLLQLHVSGFEGVGPRPPEPEADDDAPPPDGHTQMTVQWTIRQPEVDTVLAQATAHHRTEEWRVDDYGGLVARLGRGLDVLVDDVGTQLQRLHRP